MKITLNLATKPWVDTATQVRRLRIAAGVCVGVILLCMVGLHFEAGKALRAQQKRDQMDAQQAKLTNEKHAFEQELQQPQNQAILERSQFLNQIFAEKSFSWTSVMMDLENVLPAGVQVASLDPQVAPDGSIVVRLRVRGDRDRAVDMIRNLERSKHFVHSRLAAEATEAQQGQNAQPAGFDAGAPVAFEILADYNDAPEKAKAGSSASPQNDKAGKKGKKAKADSLASPQNDKKSAKKKDAKTPNPGAKLNPHPTKPANNGGH